MQIKITIRPHNTCFRIDNIKNYGNTKFGLNVEQVTYCGWEYKLAKPLWKADSLLHICIFHCFMHGIHLKDRVYMCIQRHKQQCS